MHRGVVQHLARPDEGVDHFGVDVGGVGGGGIVEEDVMRRLGLGDHPKVRQKYSQDGCTCVFLILYMYLG